MRKLTTILGIALLVATLAVPVFAWGPGWGRGHHMMGYWGGGSGYGERYDKRYGNLSEEQRSKLDQLNQKFYSETNDLRNRIWEKSAELDTVLNSSNPDLEKAKALQSEISALRSEVSERELNYELEARKITPDERFGRGYGRGDGRHMGGYGPGSCWK